MHGELHMWTKDVVGVGIQIATNFCKKIKGKSQKVLFKYIDFKVYLYVTQL